MNCLKQSWATVATVTPHSFPSFLAMKQHMCAHKSLTLFKAIYKTKQQR